MILRDLLLDRHTVLELVREMERSLASLREQRRDFRVVQYSLQADRGHFIVEAKTDSPSPSSDARSRSWRVSTVGGPGTGAA
jgi:hypothetical protein